MDNNPKIYNRSVQCILVGYSDNSKAYQCWDRISGHIHVTRNIVFTKSQDLATRVLHPGVVVNEECSKDNDEESYCNTMEAATSNCQNTPSPPEELLSQQIPDPTFDPE